MKRAICLPYTENQNAPSVPLRKIISLPDSKKERDALLKKIFVEQVCPDTDVDQLIVRNGRKDDDYGDLIVAHEYGIYMFVTYIED